LVCTTSFVYHNWFCSYKKIKGFFRNTSEEGRGVFSIFHFSAYARRAKSKKEKPPHFSARGLSIL
jgi:hypothetical protein